MPEPRWPQFRWDARTRRYHAANGRIVSRQALRQALDETIDSAAVDMERSSRRLQAGTITLIAWQLAMEKAIKQIHTASAAIGAGGWAQATAADWAAAGRRIRQQYGFLAKFANQIANGLPLDGRFLNRAVSYAAAGSGTYEAVLRRRDIASGTVLLERRRIHSQHPCDPCIDYQAAGWQEPGVLPGIGEECDCHSHCRCTFERKFVTVRSRQAAGAP